MISLPTSFVLTIPAWLIVTVFYIGVVTVFALILAAAWWFILNTVVSCLKQRHLYDVVRIWLTRDKLREQGEAQTFQSLEACLTAFNKARPQDFDFMIERMAWLTIARKPGWLDEMQRQDELPH